MGLGGPPVPVLDEKADNDCVWLLREYPGCSTRPAHPCRKTRRPLGQRDNFREVSSWQRPTTARATLPKIALAIALNPKPATRKAHPFILGGTPGTPPTFCSKPGCSFQIFSTIFFDTMSKVVGKKEPRKTTCQANGTDLGFSSFEKQIEIRRTSREKPRNRLGSSQSARRHGGF